MSQKLYSKAGLSFNGLPFIRVGDGAESLVIFTSGSPDNRVPKGLLLRPYVDGVKVFAESYTVYHIKRKIGLTAGYTTQEMARDYAEMIRHEIGGPCHVMGISAGGFIAEHFAIAYPELVDKLIIVMAGYRLEGNGRQIVQEWRELAARNRLTLLLKRMFVSAAHDRRSRWVAAIAAIVMGWVMRPGIPVLDDFVITLDALLAHDARDKLARIPAPTLIVAGEEDVFYPETMLREMNQLAPDSRLVLYPGIGHGILEFRKKEFEQDVSKFLNCRQKSIVLE
ncbi:MAG: alpha/beta hydrolase [Anaerolineales bacterium]|nr:alpha/beta hydrolase [Anaerolineales bacterium]